MELQERRNILGDHKGSEAKHVPDWADHMHVPHAAGFLYGVSGGDCTSGGGVSGGVRSRLGVSGLLGMVE